MINPGQSLLRREGIEMSILDEIPKEKQRVNEALARVDIQREKLTSELGELDATERVLARYSKGPPARKTVSDRSSATATDAAASARSGGRLASTRRLADGKRNSPNLNDQVLALATGKTQKEITAECEGARPNHVGRRHCAAQTRWPDRRARRYAALRQAIDARRRELR